MEITTEEITEIINELKQIEELLMMHDTRINTINERTKNHTLDIKELKKQND